MSTRTYSAFALLGGAAALLAFSVSVSARPPHAGPPEHAGPSAGMVCQGDQKIEGVGGHNYSPGSGVQVESVCIKAGPQKYTFSCGETDATGCYSLDWGAGCESVTVSGGGTGRDCKDISHTTAEFGPLQCVPTADSEAGLCNDGIDNDCDGATDLDDLPECEVK